MPEPELADRCLVLLVSGTAPDRVEAFCISSGCDPTQAAALVSEARTRITLAAEYVRDEQLGQAVLRLNDLYAKASVAGNVATALQAQRELNKLLRLYGADEQSPNGKPEEIEAQGLAVIVELVEGHLFPLRLTDEGDPVEEHARIAADIIRRHGLHALPAAEGTSEAAERKDHGQGSGHRPPAASPESATPDQG